VHAAGAPPPPGGSSERLAPRLQDATRADIARHASHASAPPPPGSLRDTDVDGALAVDASGRLLLNPDLRRFFEYFFVASGEESDAQIRARIGAAIAARLEGDAARTAYDVLDRFLDYRNRGESLNPGAAGDDRDARFAALRRLRNQVFGEHDAAALFADEEAAYAAAVAEQRIRTDSSLSDAERAAQLAGLEAQLPESIRAVRQAVSAPLRLARDEAALRTVGGSAEEIEALREQAVGPDAAARLAALDAQQSAWRSRVDTYRQERSAIDANAGLDAAQRAQAVAALRARHFSGPELVRIEALDRIEP
jgi:lipase chaperone LimK